MQQSLLPVIQTLWGYKEGIGKAIGIATGAIGFLKTLTNVWEGRSLESRRDKLLTHIRSLSAAGRAFRDNNLNNAQTNETVTSEVELEIARSLEDLNSTLRKLRAKQAASAGLNRLQRFFLLYKPKSRRAWIPHVLCWIFAILMPLYVLATLSPPDSDKMSLGALFNNWAHLDTLGGLLTLFGLFFMARLWGILELKRQISGQNSVSRKTTSSKPGIILALLYATCGLALVVGAGVMISSDLSAGIKFAAFGLVLTLCGIPLYSWARLRTGAGVSETLRNVAVLFVPPVMLLLAIVFNLDGIIILRFRNNIFGYWGSWWSEPVVPLVFVPIGLVPLIAALRSVKLSKANFVQPQTNPE